jgi:diguanylate cyclase (GGDEF)-like protein
MTELNPEVLEQLIEGSAEPVFVARIDHPDWPVVLSNSAFGSLADFIPVINKPLADVVEHVVGRELAVEIAETIRGGQETTIAVELGSREYLLVLKPLASADDDARYYAAYWRGTAGGTLAVDTEIQQALLKAKRRIRDLSRDDPVTGLLNAATFREVLSHDWAVAAREASSLSLVAFTLDDFPAYLEVFGRHAADSCLRRVAQAIRRCLRRASDVAARLDTGEGDCMIVLSHSSNEAGVNEFAATISAAVRELGLHHPRSREAKFVTVSYRTSVMAADTRKSSADDFLGTVLEDSAGSG